MTKYLTIAELAERLHINPKTVYRWAKEPSFPVLRVGGAVRFPEAELERWLQARTQGQPDPRRSRTPLLDAAQVGGAPSLRRNGSRGVAQTVAQQAP